jgi:hypothetical protein
MRPRRKSATRATFGSCRHPGIFIERVCFFKTELELEADDEGAHGQKKHQAAGHDGEE